MDLIQIKSEINRISKISDPGMALAEIKNLDRAINAPKIKKIKRSGRYDFYSFEYYYDSEAQHSRERILDNLGSISFEQYKKNEELIEGLRKKGDIEGLNRFL